MSTNFYSGYAPEKPTSKVLNPPGGRSNNIFGSYEDDKKTVQSNGKSDVKEHQENLKPQLTPQQEAVLNKQHQESGSTNILGASYDQQVQHHASPPKPQQQPQPEQPEPVAKNRSQRTGFNPITGEDYGAEKVQQNSPVKKQQPEEEQKQGSNNYHSSSRVLQPPGGKSTKLW